MSGIKAGGTFSLTVVLNRFCLSERNEIFYRYFTLTAVLMTFHMHVNLFA